jgi:hypothetical protein
LSARIPVQIAVSGLKIVTLPQQSSAFRQYWPESPKKAAIATVFGLPFGAGRDVDLHALHVDLRIGGLQPGPSAQERWANCIG